MHIAVLLDTETAQNCSVVSDNSKMQEKKDSVSQPYELRICHSNLSDLYLFSLNTPVKFTCSQDRLVNRERAEQK